MQRYLFIIKLMYYLTIFLPKNQYFFRIVGRYINYGGLRRSVYVRNNDEWGAVRSVIFA